MTQCSGMCTLIKSSQSVVKKYNFGQTMREKKADGVIDTHWISIIDQNLQTIETVAIHCHKMLFKPIMISDNTQTKYCKLTAKHTINQHDKCCQQLSVWLLKGVFNSMNMLYIQRNNSYCNFLEDKC